MPVLDDHHDLAHPVGQDAAWSESYYFNSYCPRTDVGFIARTGIRPNAGLMDAFVWAWLPGGGAAALRFEKAQSSMIDRSLDVGGIRFEMLEPMRAWRLHGAGRIGDGQLLELDARFDSLTPAIGVDTEGERPIADEARATARRSLASGHLEQAGRWAGRVVLDSEEYSLDGGHGNRDKSWGPRRTDGSRGMTMWRWFSINLGDDTHLGGIRVGTPAGDLNRGWVWSNGAAESVRDWGITTAVAEDQIRHTAVELEVSTKGGNVHRLHGDVMRNDRLDGGEDRRPGSIVYEGLTRWIYEGRVGYGISEYVHVLGPDGRPVAEVE